MQQDILNLINKNGCIFSSDIVKKLKIDNESKESIRRQLKQMRKYKEVNFVYITFSNCKTIVKKYPIIQTKIINKTIRKPTYLYFAK